MDFEETPVAKLEKDLRNKVEFKDIISQQGILKALQESGYTHPTPIQAQAIPVILEGNDVRGSAQTGTGKTAAFLLPTLCRIAEPTQDGGKGQGPRVLVLVPTRELAMQVATQANKYSKYLNKIKTVCIYGGAPYGIQMKDLSRPYEILVATPGRLMDFMNQGKIKFSRLELFILDEADRMLDMGFIDDVEQIAEAMPARKQTLMFSATMKGTVLKLSQRLLKDPVEVKAEQEVVEQVNIEQHFHNVDNIDHKYRLLDEILLDDKIEQAIIFTATKDQADVLENKLSENGERVAALHGGMRQGQRTRTIAQLRQGKLRVLVATDVAARGIDIPAISHVINFDLPKNAEDYVHRIGRTGRAGAKGTALSFTTHRDKYMVREIERFTDQKFVVQGKPSEPQKKKRFGDDRERPARKSFGNDRSERFGRKSFAGGDRERPARKSFGGEDRPARKSFGDDRPPRKSFGGDRPFKKDDKPFSKGFKPKKHFSKPRTR